MELPGPPLSEQDARKYFSDVVLGIEYCKSDQQFFAFLQRPVEITLYKLLLLKGSGQKCSY